MASAPFVGKEEKVSKKHKSARRSLKVVMFPRLNQTNRQTVGDQQLQSASFRVKEEVGWAMASKTHLIKERPERLRSLYDAICCFNSP